jgi:hypothetical protein
MSTYATISGHLTYNQAVDYRKAIAMLEKDGWLVDGYIVDELNRKIIDDPDIDDKLQEIRIPLYLHRNLCGALDELFRGATGKIVWTSTDGMFNGGVIVDGKETHYDLDEWAKMNIKETVPGVDKDFDRYCECQRQVEESFFEQFT